MRLNELTDMAELIVAFRKSLRERAQCTNIDKVEKKQFPDAYINTLRTPIKAQYLINNATSMSPVTPVKNVRWNDIY